MLCAGCSQNDRRLPAGRSAYNALLFQAAEYSLPFCELSNSLRVDVQDDLLNKLESVYRCKINLDAASDFDQEQIELYCIELEEYLCNMRVYYRELSLLLKEESDNSHRIALLSPVEEYLQTLIEMTELVIYTTECTQVALEEWCFCLEVWELQEMYN